MFEDGIMILLFIMKNQKKVPCIKCAETKCLKLASIIPSEQFILFMLGSWWYDDIILNGERTRAILILSVQITGIHKSSSLIANLGSKTNLFSMGLF